MLSLSFKSYTTRLGRQFDNVVTHAKYQQQQNLPTHTHMILLEENAEHLTFIFNSLVIKEVG